MENNSLFEIKEDLRQSAAYGKYMEKIGWKTFQIPIPKSPVPKIQTFIKKLGPVSFAKIQRTRGVLPMDDIEKILKLNHTLMCKIEPMDNSGREILRKKGYKINREPLLGTKTLRVNLRPGKEDIYSSFKKDCRYILRKIPVRSSEVEINSFGRFYEIWKQSAKRKGLWIPSFKEFLWLTEAFGNNCFSITINDNAGAVILINKEAAFYYYAGSTRKGIRENLPYAVIWEGIKQAKKRGCEVFDFEGIYDNRWPNQSWKGFSHFKKSFGGAEILFPGSFGKWLFPW